MRQGSAEDAVKVANLGANWSKKFHVVDKINKGDTNGFLDTNAGVTIADKAGLAVMKVSHANIQRPAHMLDSCASRLASSLYSEAQLES